jgi:hypothetical protein
MYIYADKFDSEYILGLLPEKFDERKLDDIVFIEAELSNISKGELKPNPRKGINLATSLAHHNDPIILIGLREYPEIPEWQKLLGFKKFAFCKKAGLTGKILEEAINKVKQ